MCQYPQFDAEIRAMGGYRVAAAALGLSTKSLRRYVNEGKWPAALRKFIERPALLRALLSDVETKQAA